MQFSCNAAHAQQAYQAAGFSDIQSLTKSLFWFPAEGIIHAERNWANFVPGFQYPMCHQNMLDLSILTSAPTSENSEFANFVVEAAYANTKNGGTGVPGANTFHGVYKVVSLKRVRAASFKDGFGVIKFHATAGADFHCSTLFGRMISIDYFVLLLF